MTAVSHSFRQIMMVAGPVSPYLQLAFKVHCVVDLLFAVPLVVYPAFLEWFGFARVDPYAARLFAAALFGIGLSSWDTKQSVATYRKMLKLKIIFSGTALIFVFVAIGTTPPEETVPWGAFYLILPTFAGFHVMWQYFLWKIGRGESTI